MTVSLSKSTFIYCSKSTFHFAHRRYLSFAIDLFQFVHYFSFFWRVGLGKFSIELFCFTNFSLPFFYCSGDGAVDVVVVFIVETQFFFYSSLAHTSYTRKYTRPTDEQLRGQWWWWQRRQQRRRQLMREIFFFCWIYFLFHCHITRWAFNKNEHTHDEVCLNAHVKKRQIQRIFQ